MKKIVCTTGSRAEYGVLKPFLKEIVASKKLDLYLVVAGMHLSKQHGMSLNEIKKDGFNIYDVIDSSPKGDTTYHMSLSIGYSIIAFSNIFRKIKPDFNVVIGDRDEMLSSAIAASHMNIPNVHIHGGDRSGGIDEYNRHAITKLSNIHFAPTKMSRNRILKMGENPKSVFLTGALANDGVLENRITSKTNFKKKYNIHLTKHTIVVLQHPVTTQKDLGVNDAVTLLQAIVQTKKPTIAIAPNTDAGGKEIFKHLKLFSNKHNFIHLFPNLPRQDYLALLKYCGVLIGNSSSAFVEAPFFNISVINIGIRQKGRESNKKFENIKKPTISIISRSILRHLNANNNGTSRKYLSNQTKVSTKIVKFLEKIEPSDFLQKGMTF